MSPKRRYQSSSIGIGLPSPFKQSEQYYRPITPAEIASTPVITSRKSLVSQGGILQTPKTPVKDEFHHEQPRSRSTNSNKLSGSKSSHYKGDRTYRVHPTPVSSVRTSLSQGIFGLPVVHDYFNRNECDYEDLGGTKILDGLISEHSPISHLKEHSSRQRMRSTLPPSKPVTAKEEMDGIIHIRPASRSNNPVQAHIFQHHNNNHTTISPRSRTAVVNQDGYPQMHGHSNASHSPGARKPIVRRSQSNTGVVSGHGSKSCSTLSSETHQQFELSSAAIDIGSRLSQLGSRNRRPSTPVDNPQQLPPGMVETLLQDSLVKLKSSDWEEICEGFRQTTNLSEYYPFQVRSYLKKLIWNGLPHLSSSRTKVSRSACQCFKRLYETQRRFMEGEGDKVFSRLLDLCGGPTNKFIQEECKDALLAAVGNIDTLKGITLIEMHGAKHKNPNVKEFAAYLLNDIMSRQTTDRLLGKEYCHKVIPLIVGFLREGHLNTRLNAKDCLEKVFDHPLFDSKLRRFVPPESIRHVTDTLRKFRLRRVKSTSQPP